VRRLRPPAAAGPLAGPGRRVLYELATCTDTGRPDSVPHPRFVREVWDRYLVAMWDNWEGLVLHDHVVFLGRWESKFTTGALPSNVEQDYFPLYLFALFQKLWLSGMFGELIRPRLRKRANVGAARRLWDAFLLFQNRYWFVELTRRPLPVQLYRLYQQGLGVTPLYEELAEQVRDLERYHEQKAARQISRLLVSVQLVALPVTALAHLFGFALIERGLWLLGLGVLGVLYTILFGLWWLWNSTSRD